MAQFKMALLRHMAYSFQQLYPMKTLTFQRGNAKLGRHIFTFSLPAGYTCPGAKDCLSFAHRQTGKIRDGKETQFRCFAASQEAAFPSVRRSRWANFEALQEAGTREGMAQLIAESLPKAAKMVRIHVSGDFFSADYLAAWMDVARQNPDVVFYAYTKSIPFWERIAGELPANFRLTKSLGGKFDEHGENLKTARVVYTPEEAENLGLEIDHDDSHAYDESQEDFALLIHGTQPKGSKAAGAIRELKQRKVAFSYSKK